MTLPVIHARRDTAICGLILAALGGCNAASAPETAGQVNDLPAMSEPFFPGPFPFAPAVSGGFGYGSFTCPIGGAGTH
jgi:hypothetical protein